MRFLMIVREAFRSLRRAPLRSALTALGVIVGVAAILATTSIGSGAKVRIQETLSKPESRTVYLYATVPPSASRYGARKLPPADGLQPDDYYAIRRSVENILAASPRIYVSGAQAAANGRAAEILLEGIDVEGFATQGRTLLEGALFGPLDVRHAATVCVVSESLARKLRPEDPRPGFRIRLNDIAFTVIGIVDDIQNTNRTTFAPDLHAYVPFTSLRRRLDSTTHMSIAVQARSIEQVGRVQQAISDVMEQRRSGRKADFRTVNAFESIKTYADGSMTVARLLAAVGAISLVVGGIGIMNIMLVSVGERTREIGIRMAVGTRSRDILSQFLTEATALSVLGGGIGIATGCVASWLITRVNGWPTSITMSSVVSALLCSVAVGTFFGYHPARRAALLSPVEALRTEH